MRKCQLYIATIAILYAISVHPSRWLRDRTRVRADRGREADQMTNPRVCSRDIERAFTRRLSSGRSAYKNRQPIMRGELASHDISPLFGASRRSRPRNPLRFSIKLYFTR